MTDAPLTSWERSHRNGTVARVLELLWTKKNDAFTIRRADARDKDA
jgi:hypothetical protein